MVEPLPLSCEVVPRPGPASRLLVLVHGYGQPTTELTDRLDRFDPEGRFLVAVPDAPFERRGGRVWHRALSERDEAERQLLVSLASLDALLGELEGRTGLPAAEAVVGGFSQGGGLAMGLLLGADVAHRPSAGFGVCSFPPMVRGFRVDRRAAAGRPYLLTSARQDRYAPIEACRACARLVRASGPELTYLEEDGGHELTDELADRIGAWLTALHRGDPLPPGDDLSETAETPLPYEGLWEHVS